MPRRTPRTVADGPSRIPGTLRPVPDADRIVRDAEQWRDGAFRYCDAKQYELAFASASKSMELLDQVFYPDQAGRVEGLRCLGQVAMFMERYDMAKGFLTEARMIIEALEDAPSPRFLDVFHWLGILEKFEGSVDWHRYHSHWVTLSRQLGHPLDARFPAAVTELSSFYVLVGQNAHALAMIEDNLALALPLIDPASDDHATLRDNHAKLLEAASRHAAGDGDAVVEEAPAEAVKSLTEAQRLEAAGRYAEGHAVAERALARARQDHGAASLESLDALAQLASLCRALQDPAGARALAEEALALCATHDAASVATRRAEALCCMAECELALGRLDRADDAFQRAVEAARRPEGEVATLANALSGLGRLQTLTGEFEPAARALAEAHGLWEAVAGAESLQCGQMLGEMAALHFAAGHLEAAETMMREGLAILQKAAGKTHPACARALHDLAQVVRRQGRLDEARTLFEASTAALEAALGPDHLLLANHLISQGGMDVDDGEFAAAETKLVRALAMVRPVLHPSHRAVRHAQRQLAAAWAGLGQPAKAIALCLDELGGELELVGQLFALGSEIQRRRVLGQTSALAALLTLVTEHAAQDEAIVRSTLDQVLRRKGMTAEAFAAQRDAVLGRHHPELAEALEALRELRERIATHALAGPGPQGIEAHRRALAAWTDARDRQEAALARRVPEVALAARLRRAEADGVARALPGGAALVEFVQYRAGPQPDARSRFVAFVLHAGPPARVTLVALGDAAPILQLLSRFRAGVTGRGTTRALNWPGRRDAVDSDADVAGASLRAAIFDPLKSALGHCRRLFLAPDGELSRLPFEILPLGDGRRLIDDYLVSYLGTGRDVLRLGSARGNHPSAPLVIADPDFDLAASAPSKRTRSKVAPAQGTDAAVGVSPKRPALHAAALHFARLPGTHVEGTQVAALLGARLLVGSAALERELKASGSPQVLHIATHGFFLPERVASDDEPAGRLEQAIENPMLRSGLALAGANTWLAQGALPVGAEDALFTGEDVSALDLLSTDLVVLSACESGLGEVQTGEGVFGLQRAFLLAGAKTLLMSLWSVPDAQTQALMLDFYQRLLSGSPRAEALRGAQLALKAIDPDPANWGAFVCLGDPGPWAPSALSGMYEPATA